MGARNSATILVAALAFFWGDAISAQQATKQSRAEPARGFAVISALYGTDERWIDVTEVLRSRIREGALDFRPRRLPDPAFGIHKNLVILYSLRGKAGLSVTRDDRRVVIPGRGTTVEIPETGFAVLTAAFGHDDKWVDVTGPLRGWIADGRLTYPSPTGAALPDPVFGTHKALVVAYAVDGEPRLWVGRDDSKVTLPEAEPGRGRRADEPTQVDLDYLKLITPAVRDLQPADLLKLEELDLAGTTIDGAGLARLRGLAGLRRLSLAGTPINDIGLRALAGLTGLRALDLSDTPVGDSGMPSVARLEGLRRLSLRRTGVTDAGIARLGRLTGLGELDLSGTKVTDDGIARLGTLKGLESLILAKTRVTDAGLVHLKRLAKLRHLRLPRAGVTDAGIEGLKRAIPELRVEVEE